MGCVDVLNNFIGLVSWFCVALTTLCCFAGDGYSLHLPNYLESEVKITKVKANGEELVQYIAATVQFKDWGNYRVYTMNSSTLQDDEESTERFIFCGEEEVVVIDGKELLLRRSNENCQATVPDSRESMQALVALNCQQPWSVFFSTKPDPSRNLTTIAGIGGIVGEYELLDSTGSQLNLVRRNIVKSGPQTVEAKVALPKASYDLSLARSDNNWMISKLITKYANSPTRMDRTTQVVGENGFKFETNWTASEDNGSSRMRSIATLNPVRYDQPQSISMTSSIDDESRVFLSESPQIKAIWKNNKVLRVYDGGYVDDLGSATFVLSSSRKIPARLVVITLALVIVGCFLLAAFKGRTETQ